MAAESGDDELVRQLNRELEPVLDDLRRAGVQVASLQELELLGTDRDGWLVGGRSFVAAVPILIDHLSRAYSEHASVVMAALIHVPEASAHWLAIRSLYETEPRALVRERLAYALAVSVPDDRVDDLIDMALDTSLGESRIQLLIAFMPPQGRRSATRSGRFRTRRAELEADSELAPLITQLARGSASRRRTSRHESPEFPIDGLAEASTGFDRDDVPAVLGRIVALGIGFVPAHSREVIDAVARLEVDASVRFAFPLGGAESTLVVEVFMDDVDAPDVYFFGDDAVISRVRSVIEADRDRAKPD